MTAGALAVALMAFQAVLLWSKLLADTLNVCVLQHPFHEVAFAAKRLVWVDSRQPHNPVRLNQGTSAFGTHCPVFVACNLTLRTESSSREWHRMFGLTFIGGFRLLLTVTSDASRVREALLQKRFMFLFRDAALLSKLFAADVAVETILTFQRFMHGARARTFTVAFYAPVLNLRGKRTRQTDKHQRQAYQ